jgi:hypothetical protein
MNSRLMDGIRLNLCGGCRALWLDTVEREKFEAYLNDPEKAAGSRPIAFRESGGDFHSDYGIFASLFDFFRGLWKV